MGSHRDEGALSLGVDNAGMEGAHCLSVGGAELADGVRAVGAQKVRGV